VVECKSEGLNDKSRAQCPAELVCIHEAAYTKGKNVFAVLTNAVEYEFYTIDHNSDLHNWNFVVGRTGTYNYGTVDFGTDTTHAGDLDGVARDAWSFAVRSNAETEKILGTFLSIFESLK